MGQFLSQSGTGITKRDKFYHTFGQVLQSGALIKGRVVQKANNSNGKKQYVLAKDTLIHT